MLETTFHLWLMYIKILNSTSTGHVGLTFFLFVQMPWNQWYFVVTDLQLDYTYNTWREGEIIISKKGNKMQEKASDIVWIHSHSYSFINRVYTRSTIPHISQHTVPLHLSICRKVKGWETGLFVSYTNVFNSAQPLKY